MSAIKNNKIIILSMVLYITIGYTISSSEEIYFLQFGRWGVSDQPDPFIGAHPRITLVPAGSIIFDVNDGANERYKSVLTHLGFRTQIINKLKDDEPEAFIPIAKLITQPPSNTIIFHKSILCLGQTNPIVGPPYKCNSMSKNSISTEPIGQGWIYTYKKKGVRDRVLLKTVLTAETKKDIEDRGWDPSEAEFPATLQDLHSLEKEGYLTILNKKLPVFTFESITENAFYLKCGQKKVSKKNFDKIFSGKINANLTVGFPVLARLFSFLSAKVDAEAEASTSQKEEDEVIIEVDTTKQSYMYEFFNMVENNTDKDTTVIVVEKQFECDTSKASGLGDRIISVTYRITRPGEIDPEIYEFNKPDKILIRPNEIFDHHTRPVFLSINSPEQYHEALRNIVKEEKVDQVLANFMIATMNYGCTGKKIDRCRDIIDNK